MSSIPFYAINTSCRAAACPRSPLMFKNSFASRKVNSKPLSAEAPGANGLGSTSPQTAGGVQEDTASMMHITREQMYKEGERMCALDVFN